MQEDNIETFRGHGQAQAGLLADHLSSAGPQAGPLAHLLWVDEVLSEGFMAVALRALMVAASHAAEDCKSHC